MLADRRAAADGRRAVAARRKSSACARVTLALTSVASSSWRSPVVLLYLTSDAAPFIWADGIGVYTLGGWPAPFGIVLVADRLSAVMLTLEAVLALAVLAYSVARWDRPGQPFHSLLQFLMMGLNGAFLTGDLFNLFVFVEMLLAASYGLMLRGVGAARVGMGLHYIVVNIAGVGAVPRRRRDDLWRRRHAQHGGPRAPVHGARARRADVVRHGRRNPRRGVPHQSRQSGR